MLLRCLILGLFLSATTATAEDKHLLEVYELDLSRFPPPPSEGSPEDLKDLEAVRNATQHRTEADCERAQKEVSLKFETVFVEPDGLLNEKQALALKNLYWAVVGQTDFFVNRLKRKWMRPRPYVRDPSIELCVPSHRATAYPSGHTAVTRAAARVLGALVPGKAAALLQRADQVAHDRIIGGVHHPKDIEAGHLLGDMIVDALMKKPEFQGILKATRATMSKL